MSFDFARAKSFSEPAPAAGAAPAPVPQPANDPSGGVPVRAYAARPGLPAQGVRLLPLDRFAWGGPSQRAARVRGDNCLIRVAEGVVRIALPRSAVDYGAGNVVFIPAGTAFASQPQPGVVGEVLLMPTALAAQLEIALPDRMVAGSAVSDAFTADLAALAGRSGDTLASATAAFRLELISAELKRMAVRPAPITPGRPEAERHALLSAYLELAGREMGRGRTLADLADALGTTAGMLEETCRTLRGRSALDLLYDLRLERARQMMAQDNRSLAQIADDLGFTGIAHLNRCFLAATGKPAEAFRLR